MCRNRPLAESNNAVLKGRLCFRYSTWKPRARSIARITFIKMECVMPRCASRPCAGLKNSCSTTSTSGRLLTITPASMAFLPSFFPAMASPRQAPSTVCVSVSILPVSFPVFSSGHQDAHQQPVSIICQPADQLAQGVELPFGMLQLHGLAAAGHHLVQVLRKIMDKDGIAHIGI